MAKLYEIDEAILQCIDLETGEIIDDAKLNDLQIERAAKLENVACWYKNLLSDADAFKKEKEVLADREKIAKNKAESLKNYLIYALNGEKLDTPKVSVSYRKSEAVECADVSIVPADFLKYSEPTVDKTKVKEAIKNGVEIKGCSIVTKQNLQIK